MYGGNRFEVITTQQDENNQSAKIKYPDITKRIHQKYGKAFKDDTKESRCFKDSVNNFEYGDPTSFGYYYIYRELPHKFN
jgi:hypothetical protein